MQPFARRDGLGGDAACAKVLATVRTDIATLTADLVLHCKRGAGRRPRRGCTVSDQSGLWSGLDGVERLIARIELRLEQYRIHAEELERGSRDRESADAIVRRLEDRLIGLHSWRRKQFH